MYKWNSYTIRTILNTEQAYPFCLFINCKCEAQIVPINLNPERSGIVTMQEGLKFPETNSWFPCTMNMELFPGRIRVVQEVLVFLIVVRIHAGEPWGYSSNGRALDLHSRGLGFKSPYLQYYEGKRRSWRAGTGCKPAVERPS